MDIKRLIEEALDKKLNEMETPLDEAAYEDMLKDVNRLSGGDFTLKYQMSKAAFKKADPNRKDPKAKTRGVGLGHMKKESTELDEDVHNDLNDLIFQFQKQITRFSRSKLDPKIAKQIKALDNTMDDIRGELFKIRPGL